MALLTHSQELQSVTENRVDPSDIADPFARKLVGRYLENRRADVDRLTAALDRDDFAAIQTTGHNLLGSGAAYGLDEISRIGAEMEKAAHAHDRTNIVELLAQLAEFIGPVQDDKNGSE